jgi:hypothetical protein
VSADAWSAPDGQELVQRVRTRELRAVDPATAIALGGAIYGMFGLLGGALFGSVLLLTDGPSTGPGLIFALCAPLLYGGLGALGAGLTAFFYNVAAGVVGGIRMELAPRR